MNTTADKLNKLISTKAGIKAAIEAKGVQDVGERFADYPDKILQIPSLEYEVVNLTLTTNQATHEELIGKVVHAKYDAEDRQYTWEGETLTIKIPKYAAYTVELPEVEGYRKPGNFGYTAVAGNMRNITVSYDTELLTVTVSCEVASVDLTGQQVTIDGIAYQTPSDRTIVVKIPFGKTYDIVASERAGFDTPKKLSFTAGQAVRNVSLVYKKIILGVFILSTDGNLYSASEWNQSSSYAVGVVVATNECQFMIAKIYGKEKVWAPTDSPSIIEGVTIAVSTPAAMADYKGVENTAKIVLEYGENNRYAAGYCSSFLFANGKKGYLGAVGEWMKVFDNRSEVNQCMSKINGQTIMAGYNAIYWTSTQFADKNYAWNINSIMPSNSSKNSNKDIPMTLPFAKFKD
jgi:hypothetical protein